MQPPFTSPTSMPLVYEEIKRDLLGRIGRQWPVGTRLPSAPELARELGAGQRNTLRALQELAREGYIRSRPGRGTFIAPCLPQPTTRAVTSTGVTVAVLHHAYLSDGIFREMEVGFTQTLRDQGNRVESIVVPYDRQMHLEAMAGIDAVAVINPDSRAIFFKPHQSLVVLSTTNTVSVHASGGYDIVTVEEQQGSFMAGRYLRDAGCADVCFLGAGHRSPPTVTDRISAIRLRGFEAGWGAPLPEHRLIWAKSFCESAGARSIGAFLEMNPRPDAIFAASDDLAIGFALGGLAVGLEPGRDYQLIGFDGQHRGRSLPECPPLTSVAAPAAEMGRRAAELLLQRLASPDKPVEHVLMGCSIFKGNTVINRNATSNEETSS